MLDQDTKKRIDSARQILVGKVPDPKAQVEQITTALIYKFMDDMDRENEELGGKAKFLIGDLKEFVWGRLISRELSGQERLDLYVRALNSFSKAKQIPELFRTIFKDSFLPYRDPETLNLFLKEINGFTYDNSEMLGNAFEYLLSILGSQGDAGQFRTPRHIIDFIVEVVDPKKTDKILDPACGTAGFLISAYKHIKHQNSSNFKQEEYKPSFAQKAIKDVSLIEIQSNGKYKGDKLTPDNRKKLGKNIIGYDISPDMVRLSLVNMYLHGFNTPKIFEYDSLTYEDRWGEMFDIILANPPFMSPTGGIRPHKRFQVQANRAELLFVDYIAEHLTLKGRAGIIVPEGIIFQSSNAYKNLRKLLLEDNYLWAVISLPAGVFKPYSGVKTSILFLDRERAKKNEEILFVKVSNDGFNLGDQRKAIKENDLPEAYSILNEWQKDNKKESKLANWVNKKEILDSSDYNLMSDRYRETIDYSNTQWKLETLKEVSETISDGDWIESKDQSENGIRLIQTGNVGKGGLYRDKADKAKYISEETFKRLKCTEIFTNDLLISRLPDPVGRACLIPNLGTRLITAVDCTIIRTDKTKILPRFLFYLTTSEEYYADINKYLTGSSRRRISRKNLEKVKMPIPPIPIQMGIVAELDGYQRVIDGARQIVNNWKPTININPDWPIVKLGKVANIKGGFAFKSKDFIETGTQVIKMANVKKMFFDVANKQSFLPNQFKEKYKDYLLKRNDILISMTGTVGKTDYGNVCIVDRDDEYFLNQRVGKYELKDENVSFKYIYYLSQQKFFRTAIFKNSSGGIRQANVSNKQIESINIPVPSLKEQKEIASSIETEQKVVESAKKLIATHEQKIKNKMAEIWGE